jgi:membrane-associated phospholipid phosphatase
MSEGIITFPSFHAALGIIFIAGLWPIPVLRWIGLIVNVLMIAATPVEGGHYFIDVLAGVVIALLCQLAARRIVQAVPAATAWKERRSSVSIANMPAS